MKVPFVKTKYSGYSDSKLNMDGKNIIERMTDNANFVNPSPSIADVLASWTAFSTALPLAQTGDRTKIAVKNANKTDLVEKLGRLGAYINFTANGDVAQLLSSGYVLGANGSNTNIIVKPSINVTNGDNPGEMKVSVNNTTYATSYLYEYTADPVTEVSVWMSKGNNTRQFTFTNLAEGKKFWFRVTAIGTNSQELMSDIVAAIAF